MKKLHNRILSLLTALAMVITLFSGITLTAQAKEEMPVYRNVMYYGDWSIWGGRYERYMGRCKRRSFERVSGSPRRKSQFEDWYFHRRMVQIQ